MTNTQPDMNLTTTKKRTTQAEDVQKWTDVLKLQTELLIKQKNVLTIQGMYEEA